MALSQRRNLVGPLTQPKPGNIVVWSSDDGALVEDGGISLSGSSQDAFSRLRVSAPEFIFDTQLTYDLQPLLFEAITNGSGASIAHDTTNRAALMTFSSTPTGGKAYLQTYEYFRYQPGRSHQILATFNFIETSANTLKFVGYSDGNNGIECQLNGSTLQFVIYSDTDLGDETVTQANWNLDKLNGSGASGLTLDLTKTQILIIDFQALYVGRVRVGFDIGGEVIYAHEFNHANTAATPYLQTANLPLRVGMTCTGTVSTTMRYICSSIISEGGDLNDLGLTISTPELTGTAGNGSRAHIASIRPKTTFNSITNRIKLSLDSLEVTVTGANPVFYELVIGQAITGASYADVNSTYSGFETSGGTISGSPALVLASGYCTSGSSFKQALSRILSLRSPVTLDAAGAVRALGTLSILGSGISGTSAMRCSLSWREIR